MSFWEKITETASQVGKLVDSPIGKAAGALIEVAATMALDAISRPSTHDAIVQALDAARLFLETAKAAAHKTFVEEGDKTRDELGITGEG